MGIAKKTDGRYVVGVGVDSVNDYKGSASYRDIYIQLTASGATEKSEEYLTFLKDYGFHANASGEPIMPPSVNVWISNNGVTTAVEADDVAIDGSNYTICGIKWDGSAWDYSNAGQGSGGGSSLPSYSSADIGKVLTVGEGSETVQTVIVPEQTVNVSGQPASLDGVTASADDFSTGDEALMSINGRTAPATFGEFNTMPAFIVGEDDYLILYLDNRWAFYTPSAGTYAVSLTGSVPSVEPKWENVGLPDYSNAAEGAVLTIVNGVPTWATT